jgi:hypothetical protein
VVLMLCSWCVSAREENLPHNMHCGKGLQDFVRSPTELISIQA